MVVAACSIVAFSRPSDVFGEVVRDGREFLVNAYTPLDQTAPTIAPMPNDGFVVLWDGLQLESGARGILGRKLNRYASPVGSEFQVNTSTEYDSASEGSPEIAVGPSGEFVVVWEGRYDQDGSDSGIFAQRLTNRLEKLGTEFRVNSYATYEQARPHVAINSDGAFVVVWEDSGYAGFGGRGAHLTIYNPDGSPRLRDLALDTARTSRGPDVATAKRDEFLVVWSGDSGGETGHELFGQRFTFNGRKLGREFQVNSYTTGHQAWPTIAAAEDGSFVVAWESDGQDGSDRGIFARHLDRNGNPTGPEHQLNAYTTGTQLGPAIPPHTGSRTVVVWTSRGQDGSDRGVFGRVVGLDAAPRGSEFQVNAYTTGNQGGVANAVDATMYDDDGRFVVLWNDDSGRDGSYGAVLGQRFCIEGSSRTCGDATCRSVLDSTVDFRNVTVSDALATLKTAVGLHTCSLCVCDVDGSGRITASDGRIVLLRSVGSDGTFRCPPCA